MRYYDKITPDGTRDLLFGECDQRSQVTKTLKDLFVSQGYRRVMTPALEFYDVFGKAAQYLPKESMYKLTDAKGRLMVLCPDCTAPVARLTATRLKGLPKPLRLYYNHNIYRGFPERKSKSVEINQVGIELIGGSPLRGDLEVVELAARSLDKVSEGKYRLELCHIGYFKAIMDSLDADDDTKEEIRQLVEQKNYAALSDTLGKAKIIRLARALRKLPRLFGGAEVFQEAYELFDENGAKESLDYLKQIYEYLQALGLGDKVLIDLGLVNLAEYYTGIIFRGYFRGLGEQVLSGGRYDKLLGAVWGRPLRHWFRFQRRSCQSGKRAGTGTCAEDTGVHAGSEIYPSQRQVPQGAGRKGIMTENSVFDTLEETLEYAGKRGILRVHLVGEKIEEYQVEKGIGENETN